MTTAACFPLSSTADRHCFVALPKAFAAKVPGDASVVVLRLTKAHGAPDPSEAVYVSWSWRITEDSTVGVPRALLQLLPLNAGDVARVEGVPGVPVASQVSVVPLSVDDSEIVECSQGEIKERLPQQLHVVYPGLVFPVYVHRTVLVRLRVCGVEAPQAPGAPVVRVADGTELVVETKPRRPNAPPPPEPGGEPPAPRVLRVGPAAPDAAGDVPTLYIAAEGLAALHWHAGLRVAVTSVSDVALAAMRSARPRRVGAALGPAPHAPPPEAPAAAPRARLFTVRPWPADRGGPAGCSIALHPNPFAPFSCVHAAPVAEPDPADYSPSYAPDDAARRAEWLDLDAVAAVCPSEVQQAVEVVHLPLRHAAVIADVLEPPSRGPAAEPRDPDPAAGRRELLSEWGFAGHLLVTGGKGYGKTSFAQALCKASGAYTVYVPCLPLASGPAGERTALAALRAALLEAQVHAPSLLLLDDLHALAPAETQGPASKAEAQLAHLFLDLLRPAVTCPRLDTAPWGAAHAAAGGVRVVAVVPSVDALHPVLAASPLCANVVTLPLPGPAERAAILRTLAGRRGAALEEEALQYARAHTHNYTPLDLRSVYTRATQQHSAAAARARAPTPAPGGREDAPDRGAFERALDGFTPSCLEGITLLKPDADLRSVGGMRDAVAVLYETLVLPNRRPELFRRLPVALRSGVLLYGPPGCGKTHVVKCVLGEAGMNCIAVNGPELLNKYIGASEQRVREVSPPAPPPPWRSEPRSACAHHLKQRADPLRFHARAPCPPHPRAHLSSDWPLMEPMVRHGP